MILGIHLGHDASASLIDLNGLQSCVLQERHSGIRHDYGINISTIDLLLKSNQVSLKDIKAIGLSSTQQMPAINQSPTEISISYKPTALAENLIRFHGLDWLQSESGLVVDQSSSVKIDDRFMGFVTENLVRNRRLPLENYLHSQFLGIADPLFAPADFTTKGKSLRDVVLNFADNDITDGGISALQMHENMKISIRGIEIPAFYWSHHACHAASNAAIYGDDRIIFTHDGGQGFQSGGFWKLQNQELKLMTLHELELGQLYDFFAKKLGLGSIGGAGKLMGLAAYGTGMIFPDLPFFGTPSDLISQFKKFDNTEVNIKHHYDHLWKLCVEACEDLGMDVSRLGNSDYVTDSASTEIAFFIQKLLEKTLFLLFSEIQAKVDFTKFGLSGGVALNCPSNSKIFDESNVKELFVEPHCEDGGCSIGAAWLTYLKVNNRFPSNQNSFPTSAYANKGVQPPIEYKISEVLSEQIADLILNNKVVGIYFQKSEIGPRALGHRSILANPAYKENWKRVNQIKGRDYWRPFAPAVLKSHLRSYFAGGPDSSPFMLFNYKVKPEFQELFPAITHLDGTSRVQTVTERDSPLFEILSAMLRKNLPPLVMNTSFNGPGQPIIEREEEAIEFFRNTKIDALLVNDTLFLK